KGRNRGNAPPGASRRRLTAGGDRRRPCLHQGQPPSPARTLLQIPHQQLGHVLSHLTRIKLAVLGSTRIRMYVYRELVRQTDRNRAGHLVLVLLECDSWKTTDRRQLMPHLYLWLGVSVV